MVKWKRFCYSITPFKYWSVIKEIEVEFWIGSWMLGKNLPRRVLPWHHPSPLCVSSWADQHSHLVLQQGPCADQHHKASEPQIVALWRWIPNGPSRDSMLLAVIHTARNEVKWHYLHNMGASPILLIVLTASIILRAATQYLEEVINKYWGVHEDAYLSIVHSLVLFSKMETAVLDAWCVS